MPISLHTQPLSSNFISYVDVYIVQSFLHFINVPSIPFKQSLLLFTVPHCQIGILSIVKLQLNLWDCTFVLEGNAISI